MNTTVTVRLQQQQDYQFRIAFGGDAPDVLGDEPAPLGRGQGPSPVQLLAAAVGNCLSDSLLFALRKFKQAPEPITCEVQAEVGRNADGRVRGPRGEVLQAPGGVYYSTLSLWDTFRASHPLFTLMLLAMMRMGYRMLYEHMRSRISGSAQEQRRALVMGAGDAGRLLAVARDADVKMQTLAALRRRQILNVDESVLDAWAAALEHDRDELMRILRLFHNSYDEDLY